VDGIVVELMEAACGVKYCDAAGEIVIRDIKGVSVPFAPRACSGA
jgi:hypothetical protein